MAQSHDLSVQLARALRSRDQARAHAVPEDQSPAAEDEVDRIKSLVQLRQDEIAVDLDGLRRQLSAQEVRHKTGEYTEAQYRTATADVRRRISSLERLEESFGALLLAETEADVRRISGRSAASIVAAKPSSVRSRALDEMSPVSDRMSGAKGLGGIPAPKWMLIGSGVLIVVGAIAVLVLLMQATVGTSLPSLPGFFQRGGDGGTPSPTSSATTPPSTATAAPATAPVGAQFQVPVQLRGAQDVGSLYVELDYDPAAVEIVSFDFAALPASTLVDHGLEPGTVSIGVVTSGGLTGDWVIAFITCRRAAGAASSGDTAIAVSELQAHSALDLAEVLANGSNGHVNLTSLAVSAPTITFG